MYRVELALLAIIGSQNTYYRCNPCSDTRADKRLGAGR